MKANSRQSHMFQAVERIPYTYLVDHEAPPLGLYRPKFNAVESSPENTHIIEDHRTPYKTKHYELDYLLEGRRVPKSGKNTIVRQKHPCIQLVRDENMWNGVFYKGVVTLESRKEAKKLQALADAKRNPSRR